MTKVWAIRTARSITLLFDQTVPCRRGAAGSCPVQPEALGTGARLPVGQDTSRQTFSLLSLGQLARGVEAGVCREELAHFWNGCLSPQTLSVSVIYVPFSALLFLGKLCKTSEQGSAETGQASGETLGNCSFPGEIFRGGFRLPGRHRGSAGTRQGKLCFLPQPALNLGPREPRQDADLEVTARSRGTVSTVQLKYSVLILNNAWA